MKRYVKSAISNLLDEHWQDKEDIAKNLNTPIDVLEYLATDTDSVVKMHIAQNPNTPIEILHTLVSDEDEIVRWGVSQNPNAPIELLELLSTDDNWEVVAGVAINPKTPVTTLKYILQRLDFNNTKYWSRYERDAAHLVTHRLGELGELEPYNL